MVQIKFITEKKVSEQELESWKTFVGLWFILPILIYLRFFCAEFEIVSSIKVADRESRLALGLWQMLMIFLELGLFIIFINNKILIKVYKVFFLVIVLSSFYIGGAVFSQHGMLKASEGGPFSIGETPESETWQDLLEENLFVVVGLTANVITLVVFNICGWTRFQADGKTRVEKQEFWDFGSYSEWIFKCIFTSVLLYFAIIFSNCLTDIGQFVIPDTIMVTLIALIMIIFGIYNLMNYMKRSLQPLIPEDSVDEKPSIDVSPA